LLLVLAVIVIGLLAFIFQFRPRVPSMPAAARLVDDKAEAKDRFVTLATVELSPSAEAMLARLRREAMGMLSRVEIRRDFPYQLKRPFYWSTIGSLAVILLFHLLVNSSFTKSGVSPQQRIRDLAEQMTHRPPLAEIARGLQSLADKLDNLQVASEEKQSLINEMQEQIERQQDREQEQDNQNLLSDASSTLKSLEQETAGGGQQEQKKDSGAVQSNASQEGQGEGKTSQGGGGDSKGELSAQLNPEMKDGKSAQGDPQGKGQEKNLGDQKEQKANQSDPNNPEKTTDESAGKMKQNSEGRSGKNRSEEMPKDGPPAERYRQPGEQGPDGIKGAKYVTVQLPEEIAADSSGMTTSSKDGTENRNRPKLPVSNVPLPAHVPEAPAEKQRMPLEYRDLIR
ncbi:MAG TPA: hypothetical protein VJQ48_10960, partial [Candidatus Binatia bacterium]|nr:hypothetical protein [Candidatus Binatia bacterium]